MSEAWMQIPVTLPKRGLLFLGAALAAVTMFFTAYSPSAQAAGENFCTNVWLNTYGSGGDRCWATGHSNLTSAWIVTHERAGCVDIANGSNELMFSWVCGGAGSSPGIAASIYDFNHAGVFRKGVIRNNNSSFGAFFEGAQNY